MIPAGGRPIAVLIPVGVRTKTGILRRRRFSFNHWLPI